MLAFELHLEYLLSGFLAVGGLFAGFAVRIDSTPKDTEAHRKNSESEGTLVLLRGVMFRWFRCCPFLRLSYQIELG